MIDRLQREFPDKRFIPVLNNAICEDMKKHTLKKVYQSLRDEKYTVKVSSEIAEKVRTVTERMLEISR
ncbi:MAG: quinolinate synthase NadA, partial [Candidatus Hadarchaeota archaeon]|nr:quinolinate synthase NadA [Candidatus Hadarchaeota archaeon]